MSQTFVTTRARARGSCKLCIDWGRVAETVGCACSCGTVPCCQSPVAGNLGHNQRVAVANVYRCNVPFYDDDDKMHNCGCMSICSDKFAGVRTPRAAKMGGSFARQFCSDESNFAATNLALVFALRKLATNF